MCPQLSAIFLASIERGVGVACVRQSKPDDETDDNQQRQDENAALGTGSSSAHERRALMSVLWRKIAIGEKEFFAQAQ